jgi:hypothetical protein
MLSEIRRKGSVAGRVNGLNLRPDRKTYGMEEGLAVAVHGKEGIGVMIWNG